MHRAVHAARFPFLRTVEEFDFSFNPKIPASQIRPSLRQRVVEPGQAADDGVQVQHGDRAGPLVGGEQAPEAVLTVGRPSAVTPGSRPVVSTFANTSATASTTS